MHPFGFASVTFDFGSSQSCDIYLDLCSFHPGICALTAGGDYDSTAGGHLVLKELKLLVEIPPCTTVLFAPAMIAYDHVAVGNGERRVSMTHSTAGNLLAWALRDCVSQGCRIHNTDATRVSRIDFSHYPSSSGENLFRPLSEIGLVSE